jgi:hypothetical protein
MKYYTVKVFANKIINDGDPNYTQEFKAYDCDDILCATYYQPNNTTGNQFIHPVMQKENIKAINGQSAIFRFLEWQRKGLDDNFLIKGE